MALLGAVVASVASTTWARVRRGAPACATWTFSQEVVVGILRDVNANFTLEQTRAHMASRPPVAGTRSVPATGCPLPAVWLETGDGDGGGADGAGGASTRGGNAIVYVHGGAFVAGSIASHTALASQIALATGARVLLIEYRLAPEHVFPAPLDDTLAAYRWLLQPEQGYDAARVAFMGDSSGGNVVLGAALLLARAGEPLPGFLGLLSPSVDLSDSIAVVDRGTDYIVTERKGYNARMLYAGGNEEALRNPLLSPLLADDLHLLAPCPMLIESGAVELHQPRIAAFAAKASAAGCAVELNEYQDMPHVFQSLAAIFPEAAASSLAAIGKYAQAHFPAPA